ncbi:MAG TPA: ABC transporter permease [Candidatus Acidoferrales bacterium]|nr:ABC transporter permease [Candidatus Acidoferrales bacterium]
MKIFSSLRSFASTLFRRSRVERDLDEELRSHIQNRADDLEHSGLSRVDAERRARIEFGGYQKYKEEIRESLGAHFIETLLQDIRFAARMLRKSPGFTAVPVLTLALGIGANTAVYSLVDELWLRPRPVPHPELVVRIFTSNPTSEGEVARGYSSYPDFISISSEAETLSGVAFLQSRGALLDTPTGSKLVTAGVVSDNFFDVLAPRAAYGQMLTAAQAGSPDTFAVMLSYPFWSQQFNADRSLLGKTIVLDRQPVRVWGILPRGFRGADSLPPDVCIPLSTWSQLTGERPATLMHRGRDDDLFGRLRPSASLKQANAELAVIAERLGREHPETNAGRKMMLLPESQVQGEGVRQLSLVLLALSGLLLLIACANVTSLLIARAEQRRHELAVRVALGAPRSRLVRQLLTEALLLGAAATVAALLLGDWLMVSLPKILPQVSFSAPIDVHMTPRVLWFSLAVGIVSVLVFGGMPAWHGSQSSPNDAVKGYGRSGSGTRGRTRKVLVVAQMAVSLVLVLGATLLLRSLWNAETANPGFDAHQNMLVMEIVPGFKTGEQGHTYVDEARRRIGAIPGVLGTAAGLRIPFGLSGGGATRTVFLPGATGAAARDGIPVGYDPVSDNFFAMLGTRILRGRPIDAPDLQTAAHVMVINQVMAQRFWPGQNPIGKRVRLQNANGDLYEVIGVAENSRNEAFIEDPAPYLYTPMRPSDYGELAMVVKTAGAPSTVAAQVRHTLLDLNHSAETVYFTSLRKQVRTAMGDQRSAAELTAFLGGLGLLLAAVGLYGLTSLLAVRRTHEIGVRMALGAQRSDIRRMVVGQGLKLALIGVAIGVGGALVLTRFLRSMLFEVQPIDPLTFFVVAALLSLVALAACYIPARRAMRVDPMVALRYE